MVRRAAIAALRGGNFKANDAASGAPPNSFSRQAAVTQLPSHHADIVQPLADLSRPLP